MRYEQLSAAGRILSYAVEIGLLSKDRLCAWANARIGAWEGPAALPEWLIDISAGRQISHGQIPGDVLPERTVFALEIACVRLDDEMQTTQFAEKIARKDYEDVDLRSLSNFLAHTVRCGCIGPPSRGIEELREFAREHEVEFSGLVRSIENLLKE